MYCDLSIWRGDRRICLFRHVLTLHLTLCRSPPFSDSMLRILDSVIQPLRNWRYTSPCGPAGYWRGFQNRNSLPFPRRLSRLRAPFKRIFSI